MTEETAPVASEEFEQMETVPKKVRHRKKKLYQAIIQQMEFYFSDSNLVKDRFLGKLVQESEDGYVDLSVFLTFNRIKNLTSNVEDIAKALRNSEMLNVSEDGLKVHRVTPVKEKENIDDCTIYVEQLPPDADHDWLKSVFSAYGKVTYVSIPKYKGSGKIKGFAFIEFDAPEEANRTLEAFGAMGCCLPTQIPPEQLCSIATFDQDGHAKTEYTGNEESAPVENGAEGKQEHVESNENEQATADHSKEIPKKRKLTTDSNAGEQTDEPIKKKKRKKDHEPETMGDSKEVVGESAESTKNKKRKKDNEPEFVEDSKEEVVESAPSDEEKTSKKKIKRRETKNIDESETHVISEAERKHRKRKHSESAEDKEDTIDKEDEEAYRKHPKAEDSGEDQEADGGHNDSRKRRRNRNRKKKNKKEKTDTDGTKIGLRILSKREWKRLRNKYLDLQKKKMKAFKQYLSKSRWAQQSQSWRETRQDSSQGDGEYVEMEEVVKPESQTRTVYTPGVIVHVSLNNPVEDAKKFKADVRVHPDVKYIDVKEGDADVYLRCSSAETAEQLVSKSPWEQMTILEGQEEASYWEKIKHDREEKLGMKVRSKRPRGRDRLLKQGETVLGKHMRFDDLEEQE